MSRALCGPLEGTTLEGGGDSLVLGSGENTAAGALVPGWNPQASSSLRAGGQSIKLFSRSAPSCRRGPLCKAPLPPQFRRSPAPRPSLQVEARPLGPALPTAHPAGRRGQLEPAAKRVAQEGAERWEDVLDALEGPSSLAACGSGPGTRARLDLGAGGRVTPSPVSPFFTPVRVSLPKSGPLSKAQRWIWIFSLRPVGSGHDPPPSPPPYPVQLRRATLGPPEALPQPVTCPHLNPPQGWGAGVVLTWAPGTRVSQWHSSLGCWLHSVLMLGQQLLQGRLVLWPQGRGCAATVPVLQVPARASSPGTPSGAVVPLGHQLEIRGRVPLSPPPLGKYGPVGDTLRWQVEAKRDSGVWLPPACDVLGLQRGQPRAPAWTCFGTAGGPQEADGKGQLQPFAGPTTFSEGKPSVCQKIREASVEMISPLRKSKTDQEGRLEGPAGGSRVSTRTGRGQAAPRGAALASAACTLLLGWLLCLGTALQV